MSKINLEDIHAWATSQKPDFISVDYIDSWECGRLAGTIWSLLHGTETAENLRQEILAHKERNKNETAVSEKELRTLPHNGGRLETNYLLAALVVALMILWMLLGL